MKEIYTFGRRPAQRNYTIDDLQALIVIRGLFT
jgi:hypothetical protein